MYDAIGALGHLVLVFLAGGVLVTWFGYALHILWGWFLVPLGVPPISIAHAVGLGAIASIMRSPGRPTPKGERTEALFYLAFAPLFALFVGYCAKQFM